nr:type II toxin-antitoxin system PemK/MazF family toxin [Microbacterium bovistercoris]
MTGDGVTLVRRGAIVLVDLDPVSGSEASKTRPAVVVSNNTANTAAVRTRRGVITVVPITSSTARVFPFHVLLDADATGLSHESKAQAEQVRAVSIGRILRIVGWVPAEAMTQVDAALRLHLAL